jgi:hypothetical protein
MPSILPRFQRELQRIEDTRKIAALLLEVEAEAHPDSNGRVYRRSADGHRTDRRRGLPMIGKGVSGTSPGTDPVAELLRNDTR